MNIVHINTADTSGGAARAAYALHKGLLQLGHNSKMLVAYKYSHDKEVDDLWFYKKKIWRRVQYYIGKLEEVTGLQYLIQPFRKSFLHHPFVRNADIINLHNLHGNYFSLQTLPQLTRRVQTIWTLHDMWAMTDHCPYPDFIGCTVWKTGKGECASLSEYPPIGRDTAAYLWEQKKKIYEESDITLVGPSKWMCTMTRESPLFRRFSTHHIPYGINTNIFHPSDRVSSRRAFKIPHDALVVMVSALPNAPRKGLPYFLESLAYIKHRPRPWILVVGSRGLVSTHLSGFHLVEVGFVDLSEELNAYLNAADLFVSPTLADNLPLSIQEALAVGVPVVSFDVGGVSDMVHHLKTGYLAQYKDVRDLARGIDLLLSNAELRKSMSHHARSMICTEYGFMQQARAYVELYQQRIATRLGSS